MIGRRPVLVGLALARSGSARARQPVPAGDRLAFHVIRSDSIIGEHVMTFSRSGDALTVTVAVDLVVGFGPIAFFRYRHRATERWAGGHVLAVDAETNDDGTTYRVAARRDATGLVVEGTKAPRYVAPPNSLPGTHWNRAMLDAPFINMQDGRLMQPKVTLAGLERLDVSAGSIEAQRFALRGDVDLDTFYDLSPSWAGLRFAAKDGSQIRYLRV